MDGRGMRGHWGHSPTGTVVISHHGGDGPAGTLVAYRQAYLLGYRWFQADVVLVHDDLIVCHHPLGRRRGFATLSVGAARQRLGRDVATFSELVESPELRDARWNFEVKDRQAIGVLESRLAQLEPRDRRRVLISAPFHRSIGIHLRNVFGNDLAIAAPWASGGTFGIVLAEPAVPYDAWQVHRWAARRLNRSGICTRSQIHVWTIRNTAQLGRVLDDRHHPVVANADTATRHYLEQRGRWPDAPPPA